MRTIRLRSLKNQMVIADQCYVAESFAARLKGLIGVRHLEAGAGMLFPRCNNIHMWFMRIPLDVIFLTKGADNHWRVSSVRPSLQPWSLLPAADFSADDTLELPVGAIAQFQIQAGDELCLS